MTRALLALAVLAAACGTDDPAEPCAIPGDGAGVDPSGTFCERLSSYRLFADLAAQTPADGVIPYDVNTPLFSDYAKKDRFLWLPPGTSLTWSDRDAFAFPPGAALIKTFSYPLDRRDPSLGRRLLETRLLVRTDTGWTGAAYVYDDATTDATLAVAGTSLDTTWIHDDGAERANHYTVPNKNQCKNCHAEHDDTIDALGPKARHLNRPSRDGAIANQLADLVARGALVGAPADPATWPREPMAYDPTTGTVDARARAWLDINCAYCHNARGGAARTSGLYLSLDVTDPAEMGICKPPVAAGRGSGGRLYGIVPGQPDASILVFRLESTEADIKMPELGRNLVDAEGVALIREWIAQMPGSCP
ncbi:MAG TPA: SO2930 family diheme c-type cytochrome [Kofleriaceae bacterium]|nr:SO2930 family diheme c-type cytochrome [Kofleriaceae bacterium]